jgi:hypothetical protein
MSTPTVQVISEIVVRNCTVTVVRRGGWSWGPDPQGLVQLVLDALPELIESSLASHLAGELGFAELVAGDAGITGELACDGPDIEITEPVTVTVRWGQGQWPGSSPPEVVVSPVPVADVIERDVPESATASFEESAESSWSPPSVTGLFNELAERGDLEPLLALLPEESVRVFLRALLGADSPDLSAVVSRLTTELERREMSSSIPEEDLVRSPASESSVAEPPRVDVPKVRGETQVWSVLPFLLAGPLARIGYLDAIGPALAGVDMAEEAPLFAAALAYKVLGVTSRGWRHAERDSAAAAAFAGLEPPLPELVGFARRVRPALPVLDGVLALSLARGHDPGDPLLIMCVADRLLLVDAQGMFPIAWAADVAGLLPHWQACGRPAVLVCDSPLPPGCLRELAAAGVRFMTDVRPLRGDPVSRLPWRAPVWTAGLPDLRLAASFSGYASRLGELVRAMLVERRAVPLAEDGALERSVTLAACLGLGTIAWMLWRDRETPDPVLALTRFADLEASVRFSADAVRVRVPLGRRHSDLLRCGLLSDVPNVDWLGGRTLTFSGG